MKAQVIYNQGNQKSINIDLLAGNKIGPQGLKGDSAYAVAKKHGFQGTEQEWLASLVGPQGDAYILTQEDKEQIAGTVNEKFEQSIDKTVRQIDQKIEDGLNTKQDTLSFETPTIDDIGKALMPKTVENGIVTSWEFGEAGLVDDVQINGISIVQDKVANVPIASKNTLGVVKVNSAYGINIGSSGNLSIASASELMVKNGLTQINAVTPSIQHESTFYGLAKAAGHDEKDSSNPVGTYTAEAKTAIRNMLDVPSVDDIPEVPVQDVQVNGTSILDEGIANVSIAPSGGLKVMGTGIATDPAYKAHITAGSDNYRPITPSSQHTSTFYGLAKAAGDTTQSASSNPVGTYTAEAKTAIRNMLDVPSIDDIPEAPVQDVKINSISILDEGVANIPVSDNFTLGVAKPSPLYGTTSDRNGGIALITATTGDIRTGTESYKPIVPRYEHYAAFYGLAKAANTSDLMYQPEDATAIRAMIGSPSTLDIPTKVSDLVDDSGHYTKPSGGIPASDLASGVVPVQDVRINMGSLLDSNGVANIPVASNSNLGLVKIGRSGGISILSDGSIGAKPASSADIKEGMVAVGGIAPSREHEAVFYGLAKAAGDSTQSASSNPVGTYTDEAKASIKTMLGVEDPVDVQINGTSIVNNGVANIPMATANTLGVVKAETQYGLDPTQSGLRIFYAHDNAIKSASGVNSLYNPIVPARQHLSVFYGLAKAAGDTTQSASSNAVGTYTDEAKAAIKTMLGVEDPVDVQINGTSIVDNGVANIPVGGLNVLGLVSYDNQYGNNGIIITSSGAIRTNAAGDSQIKLGVNGYCPIPPTKQHMSTFYGLAKAAGDTTQSASSNPVGTYTDSAKTAIKTMLGVEDPVDVQINGTSIVDNGVANIPVAVAPNDNTAHIGLVKLKYNRGLIVDGEGVIGVNGTSLAQVKTGTSTTAFLSAASAGSAAFYGLAKAAGDTTQSASSNAVGTYTDEAKAAIKTMLGIDTITVDSIPTTEIDTLFA